jgi:hypothetical protein
VGKTTSGDDDRVAVEGGGAERRALAAEFPEWHLWCSRGGDGEPCALMATRRRVLTDTEIHAGLARTLPMGFHGDLRTQLAEQAEREDALREGRRRPPPVLTDTHDGGEGEADRAQAASGRVAREGVPRDPT